MLTERPSRSRQGALVTVPQRDATQQTKRSAERERESKLKQNMIAHATNNIRNAGEVLLFLV